MTPDQLNVAVPTAGRIHSSSCSRTLAMIGITVIGLGYPELDVSAQVNRWAASRLAVTRLIHSTTLAGKR